MASRAATRWTLATIALFVGQVQASPVSFGVGRSQFYISNATETELLQHNVSEAHGFATVNFCWITGDPLNSTTGQAGVDYAIWSFYVDGEAEASIVLQTSQMAFVGNADPSAPWDNAWFGKNSKFGGWHSNVPVPFTKSIRVTLKLPPWYTWTGGRERIFAMARGVEGLPIQIGSFTLPTNARLVASVRNATLAPLDFYTLVDIPAGTSGLMLGTMIDIEMFDPTKNKQQQEIAGDDTMSLNTLEGCWHAFSPPSAPYPGFLLGTGAEDYPESAYYFNSGPWRGPTSGLTVWDTGPSLNRVSFYKLHHRDPFFFNDGFAFRWRNGDVSDKTTGEKCTSIDGNVIGNPVHAHVSTLVYVYTWSD